MKKTGKLEEYKPIKVLNNGKYVISWGLKKISINLYSWQYEIFNRKPDISDIKHVIENNINKQIKLLIEKKFIWNNMNISLSLENQLNYQLLLNTTLLLDGSNLPETVKFKLNKESIDYTFETVDDLKDFIISMNNHIRKYLQLGYNIKDKIDYSVYNI